MISKFITSELQDTLLTQTQIYIAPSQALRPYVAKYTLSFSSTVTTPETLLLIPDASGCLIFTYDGSSYKSLLWGATSKTFIVKNDINDYPFQLFIELLPGGLFYLTGINQAELTNLQLPLQHVNSLLHSLIANAFESAHNLEDFINKINQILLSHIKNRVLPSAFIYALENIKHSKGRLSVKDLSADILYSERHLNRLFNNYLGMNVKRFSNIIKIRNALQIMHSHDQLLTDVAQISGFYDQAHFTHTFKSICGTNPKDFSATMSDFYN